MAYQIFTDKDHNESVREVFPGVRMPGAIDVSVGKEPSVKGFYGFGAAITGSSCYLLSQMDKTARRALLERVYGKDGIGLSVGRLTVGSSDYSAEIYSYDDHPFDTDLSHFSVERDERYVIPMIKEILEVRPDIKLFSSPWSPPGWMKTGGSMCGGYMREKYVETYAEYYIRYLEEYEKRGIRVSAVTPQNEAETHQHGRMPACIWHPETEANFVKTMRKKLDEKGLDVKIWMYDHYFPGVERVLWSLDNIEGLKDAASGVAFHYYYGRVEQTLALREKYPELELHFTEGGPRLYDHYGTDWCKWGVMISKALRCSYRSFTGWNLLLDETGGPNVGPFFCGGLLTLDSRTGETALSGQAKAFRLVAPYITAESEIYPLTIGEGAYNNIFAFHTPKRPLEGIFIKNKNNSACLLVNPDAEKKQVVLHTGENDVYVELLPDSLSTVVL